MSKQDLIQRYEQGIAVFEEALRGVPDSILDQSPAPGKWSIRQIAVHLADSELVGAVRFRFIAGQPGSTLRAYDQDVWTRELHYEKQSIQTALELFTATRRATAAMLRAIPESAWQSKGLHEETGEVVLEPFVEHYIQHAENHASQIRGIRAKFASVVGA